MNPEEIKAVLDQYQSLTGLQRLHVAKRMQWCQYDQVAALLPPAGRVLDVGCGHGHFGAYLALHRPELLTYGCDPDERKIAVALASRPAMERGPCHFFCGDCRAWDEIADETFDGIVVLDVLYLMPVVQQKDLLRWLAARLVPGGRLVLKTIDPRRGSSSFMAMAQEFVMVRLLRRTRSSGTFAGGRPPAFYMEKLQGFGLCTECIPLPQNRTPSVLVVGTKPAP